MRPLSATLERRLRRPDSTARLLIDADVVVRGVIYNTPDEWNTCDSTTGLDVRKDGTVRLAGTQQTFATSLAESTAGATFITDLNRTSPYWCALVTLPGGDPNRRINRVIAHLDPDPGASGRNVDQWRCQLVPLYAVPDSQDAGPPGGPTTSGDVLELGGPSPVISVVEGGTADHEVTFTFPEPLDFPQRPEAEGSAYPDPVVLVFIWAVTNTGAAAANVEWQTTNQALVNGIYGVELEEPAFGDTRRKGQYAILAGGQDVPLVSIGYLSFASDDITFSGVGNPLSLGGLAASEAAVRLIGRARVPPGTAVRFYVRDDGGAGWIEYTDGQTAADLGIDLTVAPSTPSETKRWFRVELDTNAAADVTPEVLAIGMEEVSTTQLYDVAEVESCEWIVDPVSLKARLPEARIRGLRDGVQDFNAAIDTLLSENDSADLAFNLYIGHPDDDRSTWMLVDRFPIVDDWDAEGHSHVVICVSPLAFLRGGPTGERRLPRYDTGTGEREELIYDGTATKNAPSEIWEDLILTQLGISPSWVGAPPEDVTLTYLDEAGASQTENLSTTTGLKKRIADSDAHDEVDAISFITGHATISSQGVVKAVRMRGGEGPLRAIFSADDITWATVTPGFRYRRPVLFTEYNFWDSPDDPDEVRSFHQNAIDNLGAGRISAPERLPEVVGSWITTKAIAEAIGAREVQAFGTGILQWSFGSIWPYPELELGDRIAVEVDRFAAKDPNIARSLRGALWAVGRIVGVHNVWGTQLSMAIENWADIISGAEVVTRQNLDELAFARVYKSASQTVSGGSSADVSFNSEVEDPLGMHDNVTNNHLITILPGWGGVYSVSAHVPYTGVGGLPTVELYHNSTFIAQQFLGAGFSPTAGLIEFVLPAVRMVAGDTVKLHVFGDSSSSTVTLVGGSQENTSVTLRRVPPIRAVAATPQARPVGRGRS